MPKIRGANAASTRRTKRVAGQRRGVGAPAPQAQQPQQPVSRHRSATDTMPAPVTAPVAAPSRAPGPVRPERDGWLTRLRQKVSDRQRTAADAPRPSGRTGDALGWSLVAAVVVFGVLTGLLLQGWLHAREGASARSDALKAAQSDVPRVLSYSYKTFDGDVANAEKLMTPTLRKQYADVQSKTVRTAALKYKASVTAEIEYAGVIRTRGSHVDVLVFLNQTTTDTKTPAPKLAQSRLRVDMRKLHGTWLVDKVTAF
jgi:Mce-associated membrane protein